MVNVEINIFVLVAVIFAAAFAGWIAGLMSYDEKTDAPQNSFEMQLDIFRSRLERLEELLKKRKK